MNRDLIDTQKAFHENQMAQRKDQEVKARQWNEVQRNTAFIKPIVDMKDAYAQVVAKNYQPSQQEIEYRRFTSGSFIDNAKGN